MDHREEAPLRRGSLPRYTSWLSATLLCLLVLLYQYSSAQNLTGRGERSDEFHWREVEKGYHLGRYELGTGNMILKPEVFLLRFDPSRYAFSLALASDFGSKLSDIRTLTKKAGGLAGINAHFFDEKGDPLGILISQGEQKNRIHRGGGLLTGVFYIFNKQPFIVNRRNFSQIQAQLALQSGPRLVINSKPVKISVNHGQSRRSGIAITNSGEVILFATLLRFPGATLLDIQKMLLDPALEVSNALNLDGGGSSQLYVKKNILLADDTYISGGDEVPVGLIIKKRTP